jgi:hypothetical protein
LGAAAHNGTTAVQATSTVAWAVSLNMVIAITSRIQPLTQMSPLMVAVEVIPGIRVLVVPLGGAARRMGIAGIRSCIAVSDHRTLFEKRSYC